MISCYLVDSGVKVHLPVFHFSRPKCGCIMLVAKQRKLLFRSMASTLAGMENLFETSVSFKNSVGDQINLKAVYQDTMPSGSSIGTVVALHGAPGSHKDFKYISPLLSKKSIRFIGINYPGFGVTPDHPNLKFNNVERHDFVKNVVEQLNLKEQVVYIGHSRGTENAIMMGADTQAHGIVLLNPTGLRIHKGIKPLWFLQVNNRLYNAPIPGLRYLLEPFFFQVYKIVKLKVPDGKMAAHCMQTMENVALGKQKPFIDQINSSHTKVLFCYAGKDWLIENEISEDCAHAFKIEHLYSTTKDKSEEESILSQASATFKNRGCSVFFEADGHFLQKDRAEFIANAIEKMLTMLSRNVWRQIRKYSILVDKEVMLYKKKVTFTGGNGHEITVDAVYQDTHPEGGGRAVIFAQHGAPGSHNDFKYMTPVLKQRDIRVISINYPGHGFTENDHRLTWENYERNNFAQSLLKSMNLLGKKNLIFLGHSRGGENSLQLGVHHIDDCIGIVMLNCPGLRMHRGIRPFWPLKLAIKLVSIDPLKPIMHPLTGFFYNKIGLRVPNGEVAATALLNLRTFAFEKQKPLAEYVSKHPTVRVMYGFSGNDFLIERENSEEFALCFDGRKHVECHTKGDPHDDERVSKEVREHFLAGNRLLTAYFHKEDHFLQKHRANTIIEAIDAMVTHHEKPK